MTSRPIYFGPITICMVSAVMLGCGTTRMTDTARTATEQLLISTPSIKLFRKSTFDRLPARPCSVTPST